MMSIITIVISFPKAWASFLPSIKMPDFMDGNRKIGLPSMKRAVFVDKVRDICYICMI